MKHNLRKTSGVKTIGSVRPAENKTGCNINRPYWSKIKQFTVIGERKDSLL